MTSQQDRVALEERLRQVLGTDPATTLMAMLPTQEDLATRADLATLGTDLRAEMGELRAEVGEVRAEVGEVRSELRAIRQEMDLKYATKDDLMAMKLSFDTNFHAYVRSFIATQAATVVAMTGVFYALVKLT